MAENVTNYVLPHHVRILNAFDIVSTIVAIIFVIIIVACIILLTVRIPWKRLIRRVPGPKRRLKLDKVSLTIKTDSLLESEEACSVCLGSIQDGISLEMICKHKFHKNCITTWIDTNNFSCPVCRKSFDCAR